jgi:hypothetical protein
MIFQRRKASHRAVFSETTIHYIFTWSTRHPLDLRKVASKVMSAGIADTVGSPTGPIIRVSRNFKKLEKNVRVLESLQQLSSIEARSELIKWISKNPNLAARILATSAKRKASSGDRERARPLESTAGIKDSAEQLKNIVSEAQVVNAIQHEIENELYASAYLSSEPYLRFRLKYMPCWLAITDQGLDREEGDISGGVLLEAVLLVHRSGVMQLTFVLSLPDNLNADQLVSLTKAGSTRIVRSEIAEPVLRRSAERYKATEKEWLGEWATEENNGCRWRQIDHSPASTLADVFEIYRDAIEEAAKADVFDEWMCHPVIFIDSLGCCKSEEEWRHHHHDDLMQIAVRIPRLPLRQNIEMTDHALTKRSSVYSYAGSTTVVSWNFSSGRSDFADQLRTVVLIEHVLLRYWQLVTLAARVALVNEDIKSAPAVQREAIFGLQEYGRTTLVYGTAEKMAGDLLADLQERRIYQRILDSLDLLQQVIATNAAKRASRVQNIVAGAAIFAAVILGLPTVKASLQIVAAVPRSGAIGKLAIPLQVLARHGAAGIWEAYLGILVVVILTVAVSGGLRRPHIKFGRTSPPGMQWPFGTVNIIRREVPEPIESKTGERFPRVLRRRKSTLAENSKSGKAR